MTAACRSASLADDELASRVAYLLIELLELVRRKDPDLASKLANILVPPVEKMRGREPSTATAAALVRGRTRASSAEASTKDDDATVVSARLENHTAGLSAATLDALVARARAEPALRSALIRRPELSRVQAARLAAFVSTAGRERLSARFGAAILEVFEVDTLDAADQVAWVQKRAARGDLTASSLLPMLRRGWSAGFREGLRCLTSSGVGATDQARDPAATLGEAGVDRAAAASFAIAGAGL